MKWSLSQRRLDRLFRLGITLKGVDGALEMLGGALLATVPVARIHGWVVGAATYEIAHGEHAFIGNYILRLDHSLTPHVQVFAVVYLLGHGAIKVFLAGALLRRHYRLYPYAIAFLLAFIVYQSYRIGVDHSVGLALLTAFDATIAGLTFAEWRRHRMGGVS